MESEVFFELTDYTKYKIAGTISCSVIDGGRGPYCFLCTESVAIIHIVIALVLCFEGKKKEGKYSETCPKRLSFMVELLGT